MPITRKRARLMSTAELEKLNATQAQISEDEEDDQDYSESESSSAEELESAAESSVTEHTIDMDNALKSDLLNDKNFLLILSKRLKQQIDPNPRRFENSVVFIDNTFVMDDHSHPWLAKVTNSCSGSGFVITYEGRNFLMSNAHVVEMTSFLTVRLADEAKKYTANIEHIDHDCDLSILSVDDPEFWSKVEPLELGELPKIRSAIAVVGFPGGRDLCITEGTVSHFEVDTYTQGNTQLLQFQVTAPINPGNSGGPVINPLNEVIGVAFQVKGGDGEGFIIPVNVMRHFIDDYTNSQRPYQGFPELAFEFQTTQNSTMKEYHGLTGDCGIVVSKVYKYSGLRDLLFKNDIIIAFDGTAVRDDGTVETDVCKRLHFDCLISQKQIGTTINTTILRDGEQIEVSLPLLYRAQATTLAGSYHYDKPPSFIIVTGVVLQAVTEDLVNEKGNAIQEHKLRSPKKRLGEQMIAISYVFDCEATKSYGTYIGEGIRVVTHINGEKVLNLHHAASLLDSNTDQFHVLKTRLGNIPLRNISKAENMELLKPYKVVQDRSEDLLTPPIYQTGCPEYEDSPKTATPALLA